MEERHRYGIRKSLPKLVKELDIETEVCDFMVSHNLLHDIDIERIANNKQSYYRSNRTFLEILLHKGDKDAYGKLMEALNASHQWHLVQEVELNSSKWSRKYFSGNDYYVYFSN